MRNGDPLPAGYACRIMRIRLYLLGLVVALALPLAGLLVLRINDGERQAVANAESLLASQLAVMATHAETDLRSIRRQLEYLSTLPPETLLDPAQCSPRLAELLQFHPEYTNVVSFAVDFAAICSALPVPPGSGRIVTDAAWHERMARDPGFKIGEPVMGPIAGKVVLVVAQPIRDAEGRLIGSVGITIAVTNFDPKLPEQHLPDGVRYGFRNDSGTLIWRNVDLEGKAGLPADSEASRRIFEVRDGKFRATNSDGIERHFVVKSLPEFSLIAFAGLPVDSILAEPRRKAITDALVGVAIITLLLLLAYLVARRIEAPVVALEKAARSIRKGDTATRAAVGGPAEIASLATEFNALHEARLASEQQLKGQAAELDKIGVALRERVKEMRCLYGTFSISEDLALPLPELVKGVAELLPPAWLHAEITVAEVTLDDSSFATDDLSHSAAMMRSEVVVDGSMRGHVTVAYREARPPESEGPFLAEERKLLDEIALRLGSVMKRRIEANRLHDSEERF
ncbi:MAG: HAMP domain-containing protein, partial [Gammaproteobacteria bacterium]|nr:HAMP domain-containing protein [Gammaproteobacteria bacterium]